MNKSRWAKRMKETFPFALFLSFTFGFFGPIQLYITNVNEYWFSIWDILWPCAFCTGVAFLVFLFLGALLPLKWRKIYFGLLFSLALALYIQGNFINTDYGVLNGNAIDWNAYGNLELYNTIFWLIFLVASIGLAILKTKWFYKIAKWISIYIVAVQIVTLGILSFSTDFSKEMNILLSNKDINIVSEDSNVIVFCLDTFDNKYFEEILNHDGSFLTNLDGFTYFSNNTGMYPSTNCSLPYILTSYGYQNDMPYNDYLSLAWQKNRQFKELKNNNYNVGVYTEACYVDCDSQYGTIDNIVKDNIAVVSTGGLTKSMYKITAFRYFPHIFKEKFWLYTGEFNDWKTNNGKEHSIYSLDMLNYYKDLCKQNLEIKHTQKVFRFIHLDGPHPPFTISEDVKLANDTQATYLTEAKASLNVVYEYINQLKKLNVYDQSTLIIIADHGVTLGDPANPIFLVKPKYETGNLKINNNPVCQGDLWATIMEEERLNTENAYGISVFDKNIAKDRERNYLYYSIWDTADTGFVADMTKYKISYENNDITSFELASEPEEYILGSKLTFAKPATINPYELYGLSFNEDAFTWTLGKNLKLFFKLNKQPVEDLHVRFDLADIYNKSQRIIVYANDYLCYKDSLTNDSSINFEIPKEVINSDLCLELYIELPDACSPFSLGNVNDSRELALAFTSMIIEEVE